MGPSRAEQVYGQQLESEVSIMPSDHCFGYQSRFARKWQTHLVVPLESLAGQDLLQIHTRHQETGISKRRTLQAKFTSMRDVWPAVQPTSAPDKSTAKLRSTVSTDGRTDDKQSKEDDDPLKPSEITTSTTEDEARSGGGDEPTEDAKPQATGRPVADGRPFGPEHDAVCDACAVGALVGLHFVCFAHKFVIFQNNEFIVGTRWTCMVCIEWDLCDRCHSAGIHDEHQMLKIEHPDDAVAVRAAVRIISSTGFQYLIF